MYTISLYLKKKITNTNYQYLKKTQPTKQKCTTLPASKKPLNTHTPKNPKTSNPIEQQQQQNPIKVSTCLYWNICMYANISTDMYTCTYISAYVQEPHWHFCLKTVLQLWYRYYQLCHNHLTMIYSSPQKYSKPLIRFLRWCRVH